MSSRQKGRFPESSITSLPLTSRFCFFKSWAAQKLSALSSSRWTGRSNYSHRMKNKHLTACFEVSLQSWEHPEKNTKTKHLFKILLISEMVFILNSNICVNAAEFARTVDTPTACTLPVLLWIFRACFEGRTWATDPNNSHLLLLHWFSTSQDISCLYTWIINNMAWPAPAYVTSSRFPASTPPSRRDLQQCYWFRRLSDWYHPC